MFLVLVPAQGAVIPVGDFILELARLVSLRQEGYLSYLLLSLHLLNNRKESRLITMAAPPPQTFPYDYLFKVLIIGDASVGKVCTTPEFGLFCHFVGDINHDDRLLGLTTSRCFCGGDVAADSKTCR